MGSEDLLLISKDIKHTIPKLRKIVLDIDREMKREWGRYYPHLKQVALDLTRARSRARGLALALEFDLDLCRDLSSKLNIARELLAKELLVRDLLAPDAAHKIAQECAPAIRSVRMYNHYLDISLPRVQVHRRELSFTLNLVRDITRANDQDFAISGTYELILSIDAINCPDLSIDEREKSLDSRTGINQQPIRVLKLLETFGWFCSKENRQITKLTTRDLKKDAATMRTQKRHEIFIQCVLLWHVVAKTIVPILWDSLRRFITAVLPLGWFIRKITGV
jgi:hypothetical protein